MTSSERPSRWIRTLPWLMGLLIGASAHIVWWTSTRPPAEPAVRVVTVPSPTVHVHVHEDGAERAVPTDADARSCQRERERAAVRRARRASGEASGAVVCVDGRCRIRRSFLQGALRKPSALGLPASMLEVRGSGGAAGLRVEEVPPGSVPDLLGLRSGDIILSTEGLPTRPLGDLHELARALDHVRAFSITVQRQGRRHTLRHRVIDG